MAVYRMLEHLWVVSHIHKKNRPIGIKNINLLVFASGMFWFFVWASSLGSNYGYTALQNTINNENEACFIRELSDTYAIVVESLCGWGHYKSVHPTEQGLHLNQTMSFVVDKILRKYYHIPLILLLVLEIFCQCMKGCQSMLNKECLPVNMIPLRQSTQAESVNLHSSLPSSCVQQATIPWSVALVMMTLVKILFVVCLLRFAWIWTDLHWAYIQ